MRERGAGPVGGKNTHPSPLVSLEPELQTRQTGEELLRKAHTVSQQILERIHKALEPVGGGRQDVVLLSETLKRVWKVLGPEKT